MPLALTLLAVTAGLAAVLTLGSLTALVTLLPPRQSTWHRGRLLVGGAAAVWAAATVGLVVVGAPLPAGAALGDAASGAAIARFAVGAGAPLAASALGAGLVATAVLLAPLRPLVVAWVLVGAAAATAPLAALVAGLVVETAAGTAAGAVTGTRIGAMAGATSGAQPAPAVLAGSPAATAWTAAWVVVVALGCWVGGWAGSRLLRSTAPQAADRVAASNRLRRLGWWAAPVGAVSLVAAGAALQPLRARRGDLGVEAVLEAPSPLSAGTIAVTGAEPPPLPLTPCRAVTQTSPDLLWLLVAGCAVAAYLVAVRRAGRRSVERSGPAGGPGTAAGGAWPAGRCAAWVAGCAALAWVSSGGLAPYASLLLSAQLLAHATVVVVVAPLLVAGAPVTLLRRTCAAREDGSAGLRECVDALGATRVAAATRHPPVALAVAAAAVGGVYATAVLPLALGTLLGHEVALLAVLGAGLLLARSATPAPTTVSAGRTGPEPVPPPRADVRRVVLVAGSLALLTVAACGALTLSPRLLAASWFTGLGLGVDALGDQRAGAVAAAALVVLGCAAWSLAALVLGGRRRGERHSDT